MVKINDYCDHDTCVALKELGFPQWMIEYVIPEGKNRIHLYFAQKWLREEKRICIEITCCASGYVWELCKAYHKDWFSGGTTIYTHYCDDNAINPLLNDCGKYDSYESALLEGIKEAIKILKEKEFHNLRKAFYIDESIIWIPQGKSHKEYFDSINHSDYIETKVRGYILNDTLSLYKGSDFSIPSKKEVENIVSLFSSFNIYS